MVSCRRAVFEEAEPILTAFGKPFFPGDAPGAAPP